MLLPVVAALASLGGGYNSPPQPRNGPPPPPPKITIDERLGSKVPLNVPFKDESGNRVTLGDCTAGKPTILLLAYYRCPMLCTQVLNGLLSALRATPDTAGTTFNVVVVSFDPREKPPLAALKKATYLDEYARPGAENGWHFLTGDPLAISSVADSVGFHYEYDPKTEQYAHGTGLIILSPDGTISRYLPGVRFEPRDLRLALTEASEGKVGTPADHVLLLCYQYDPATGTYTFTILRLVKWFSAAVLIGLVALIGALTWRGRRRARAAAQAPPLDQPGPLPQPQPEGMEP